LRNGAKQGATVHSAGGAKIAVQSGCGGFLDHAAIVATEQMALDLGFNGG